MHTYLHLILHTHTHTHPHTPAQTHTYLSPALCLPADVAGCAGRRFSQCYDMR